jgi:hypothetical protein
VEIQRTERQGQSGQKDRDPPIQQISWWCTSVVPATLEGPPQETLEILP